MTAPFLNAIPQACVLLDPQDRHILFANDAAIHEFQIQEIKEKPFYLSDYLIPPKGLLKVNLWRRSRSWYSMTEELVELCGQTVILCVFKPDHPYIDPVWVENAVELSEVMVHRFRSTLTGIMGFTELLGFRVEDLDADAKEEYDAIDIGLKSMQEMLNTLDHFRQIPSPELIPIDPYSLLKDIVADFKQMGEKRIQLKTNGDWSHVTVADPKLTSQIIYSILENAIDASIDETDEIIITLCATEKEVCISNKGEVISSTDEARVFNPFFTTKAKNLGLGLSRAALLAERMGMYLYLKTNNRIDGVTFALEMSVD